MKLSLASCICKKGMFVMYARVLIQKNGEFCQYSLYSISFDTANSKETIIGFFKLPGKMRICIYSQFPLAMLTSQYLSRKIYLASEPKNFQFYFNTSYCFPPRRKKYRKAMMPSAISGIRSSNYWLERRPDADYCKASINQNVASPKGRPASPKLTIGEVAHYSTSVAPSSPDRITTTPVPMDAPVQGIIEVNVEENPPEFAIDDDEEDEIDDDSDSDIDSLSSIETVIGPKQNGKNNEAAATKFEYDFKSRRPVEPASTRPVSTLMDPNELGVFGPSTRVEPPHIIRQKITVRNLKGLGPHVAWERKVQRRTVRAFEERERRRYQTEGPRAGVDDADYLEGEPERDDTWNQIDPMDYNASGW